MYVHPLPILKWGFTCGKEIHQDGIFNSLQHLLWSNQPNETTLLSTTLFHIYKTLSKVQFIALSLIFTSTPFTMWSHRLIKLR